MLGRIIESLTLCCSFGAFTNRMVITQFKSVSFDKGDEPDFVRIFMSQEQIVKNGIHLDEKFDEILTICNKYCVKLNTLEDLLSFFKSDKV